MLMQGEDTRRIAKQIKARIRHENISLIVYAEHNDSALFAGKKALPEKYKNLNLKFDK